MKSPFTCSHWEEQNYRVFLKNFLFYKRSLHSFGQRGSKCTPILRLSKKNFYSVKISPHLFGITKPNDTLFYRKKEKIFFRLWVLCFAYFEKSLSLIPTERSQMHTLNLKKFIPSLIWNWEAETHPVFTKILKNIFFDWEPWFCLLKKSLHLFPLGRGKFQPCFKKYFAVCKNPSLIWN